MTDDRSRCKRCFISKKRLGWKVVRRNKILLGFIGFMWVYTVYPIPFIPGLDPTLSKSFDLQFGYLELASGGMRLHDPTKLKARLKEQGLDPSQFADHLRAFDWGMPPHSGWGLGLDRLMSVLTKMDNVREVVLYPRDPERLSP